STGVWGVMNGARRDAADCRFFVPDPWTFTEDAYPQELNDLIDLPRYLARDYLNVSLLHIVHKLGRFIGAVGRNAGWLELLRSCGPLTRGPLRFGPRHFVVISWFEYLSGLAFLARWRREQPKFAVAFFNSLAHVQHHYWREGATTATPQIEYALQWF